MTGTRHCLNSVINKYDIKKRSYLQAARCTHKSKRTPFFAIARFIQLSAYKVTGQFSHLATKSSIPFQCISLSQYIKNLFYIDSYCFYRTTTTLSESAFTYSHPASPPPRPFLEKRVKKTRITCS